MHREAGVEQLALIFCVIRGWNRQESRILIVKLAQEARHSQAGPDLDGNDQDRKHLCFSPKASHHGHLTQVEPPTAGASAHGPRTQRVSQRCNAHYRQSTQLQYATKRYITIRVYRGGSCTNATVSLNVR